MRDLLMEKKSFGEETFQLQPFLLQVGGSSGLLIFNDSTLCKPFISREKQFYETLPEELKLFTAEYRGTIDVELQEDSTGYIVGQLSDSHASDSEVSPAGRTSLEPHNNLRTCSSHNDIELLRHISVEASTQTNDTYNIASPLNPWSLKCNKRLQKARKKQMKANNGGTDTCKFILLENVAAQYEKPCILDLKMGTRQYGDDTTEEKKLRKMSRAQNTTSGSTGFRICGMQAYQANTGKFLCQNKYYGRSLSITGVKKSLRQFLHDGYRLRSDVVRAIVHKIDHLLFLIKKQLTFRFYSSSLLIMYDGLDEISDAELDNFSSTPEPCLICDSDNSCDSEASVRDKCHVDVRIIDFAHSTHKGFLDDHIEHSGPDEGYLLGLNNLKKTFTEIVEENSQAEAQ